MRGQLVGLNPLYFYKVDLGVSEDNRQAIYSAIESLVETESKNYDPLQNTAWLGDINASGDFHTIPEMQPVLDRLPFALGEYFAALGVNAEKFQAYISRCWPSYQTVGQGINLHRHLQSNISGVYYIDIPENSGTFSFFFPEVGSEFIPGLFSSAKHAENGLLKSWDLMRASEVPLVMAPDELVLFPSKTLHRVSDSKNTDGPRISIAFDINVTLRTSEKQEAGMPPLDNWKTIDVLSNPS